MLPPLNAYKFTKVVFTEANANLRIAMEELQNLINRRNVPEISLTLLKNGFG